MNKTTFISTVTALSQDKSLKANIAQAEEFSKFDPELGNIMKRYYTDVHKHCRGKLEGRRQDK